MSNEPNKVAAQELTEKELACISGGEIWPKPMNPKDYECSRGRQKAWEIQ